MVLNQKTSFVMFSTFKANLSHEQNITRHEGALKKLESTRFKYETCDCVINNISEKAIVVSFKSEHQLDNILRCAFGKYDQKQVLINTYSSQTEILEKDGNKTKIGKWKQVKKDVAFANSIFTHNNNCYYILV